MENKSIKVIILAAILAAGIGGATCGGLTTLQGDTMTNCQYNDLKTGLLTKYPTGKEVIEIDDWQLLVAVIDKEIKKKGKIEIKEVNKDNIFEQLIKETNK